MSIKQEIYLQIIGDIKKHIYVARHQAILGANKELICLYWKIGNIINAQASWGNKFIENLATDIKTEFPDTKGFSIRNLKYMAKFAQECTDYEIVQTVSAQLTWSHNTFLLDKVKNPTERMWYAQKIIENGWSLNSLRCQIELNLYERQVINEKTNNFKELLPSPQKELALETLKDPYIFDFITLREDALEKDIEKELVKHISKLLLELGTGFAFVGNQYHLLIGEDSFYIDLLFYNIKLRCYIVVELKTGKFKPEYAGQLNFYLSAIDTILKTEQDNPSIGLLLCKEKNNLVAEFALKDISKPIGISEYKLTSVLPKDLEELLPNIEDIKNRIHQIEENHKEASHAKNEK